MLERKKNLLKFTPIITLWIGWGGGGSPVLLGVQVELLAQTRINPWCLNWNKEQLKFFCEYISLKFWPEEYNYFEMLQKHKVLPDDPLSWAESSKPFVEMSQWK